MKRALSWLDPSRPAGVLVVVIALGWAHGYVLSPLAWAITYLVIFAYGFELSYTFLQLVVHSRRHACNVPSCQPLSIPEEPAS